ncbi:LysR family transcriptional regulator [Crenobacter luteus]|uniref:LysR family transcriptional regulator n=1 Tax=Crenobacter luteus TaxID=1452487 RepID=A0A165F7I1_9NEIS|nr:LysR family transcriptional regulator [Crenobacter luteus]KZE31805.1 LysR family transcriptional regulator [Crenobacter luteus]
MDIRGLRYFTEVVRRQSFTRAAEALYVTQPTISKMVRQLEDELGMPLLIREGRSFRLTDAGRVAFERGQDVLAAMQRLNNELADLTALERGELVVGVPPMIGAIFFAPVVSAFHARYPKVELKLMEDGATAVENAVRSGQLEIGVAVLPVDETVFDHFGFVSDRLCLVAPSGSRWKGLASVALTDIADEPLILYPEDFTLSHRVADAYRRDGLTMKVAERSGHWDFIVALVAARLGVALLPERITRRIDRSLFDIVPLNDAELVWHLGLIWRRDTYLSHATRAWIDITREMLAPAEDDEHSHTGD